MALVVTFVLGYFEAKEKFTLDFLSHNKIVLHVICPGCPIIISNTVVKMIAYCFFFDWSFCDLAYIITPFTGGPIGGLIVELLSF